MVQGEISEADTPTIRLGATPSGLSSGPPPSSPHFYARCPSCCSPHNLSWLGTGTKYAGLHSQWRGYQVLRPSSQIHYWYQVPKPGNEYPVLCPNHIKYHPFLACICITLSASDSILKHFCHCKVRLSIFSNTANLWSVYSKKMLDNVNRSGAIFVSHIFTARAMLALQVLY